MASEPRKSGFVKLIVSIALAVLIGFAGATIQHNQKYGALTESFSIFCQHEGIEFQAVDARLKKREDIYNKSLRIEQDAKTDIVRPYAIPHAVEVTNASSGRDTRFSFRVVSNKAAPKAGDSTSSKSEEFRIEDITVVNKENQSELTFDWQKLTPEELEINTGAKQGYLVVGKLKKGQRSGRFEESIEVKTNMGIIPVSTQIVLASAYNLRLVRNVRYHRSRNTFLFDLVGKKERKEGVVGVVLRVPTKDLKIEIPEDGITPAGCGLQVKVGKIVNNKNGSLANIHLIIPKDSPKASFLSLNPEEVVKVKLKTNVPAVEEVEFYVSYAKE